MENAPHELVLALYCEPLDRSICQAKANQAKYLQGSLEGFRFTTSAGDSLVLFFDEKRKVGASSEGIGDAVLPFNQARVLKRARRILARQ